MEIKNLTLNLPYRVNETQIAVLTHSIKNGNQKFVQSVYSQKKMWSNEIPEFMYRTFVPRLALMTCVYNPHYLTPEKLCLSMEGDVVYIYTNDELDSAVEKSFDSGYHRSDHICISDLCNAHGSRLSVSEIAKALGVNSILDLIQSKECVT